MKIYTRTGDKGDTSLIGGGRVSKSDPRILAYGAVDELNSNIGMAIATLQRNSKLFSDLVDILISIQNELFIVGSDLADPSFPKGNQSVLRVSEKMASALEPAIDRFEDELDQITFFILPGGSPEASILHICRAVARRAETASVALSKIETINPAIIIYLNRLADMLFVAARVANKRQDIHDVAWKKPIE